MAAMDQVSSTHPTWMEIDASAVRANLAEIRRRTAPEVKVIASVKANAYGHGIVPVSKILEAAGIDMLATGSFSEAKAIRAAGVLAPVIMLAGSLPEGIEELVTTGLIPTVYDLLGAKAAAQAAKGSRVPIFLKVDCGMGRLGVNLSDAPGLIDEIANLKGVYIQGVYTHLSFKDAEGMAYTEERLALFYKLLSDLRVAGHKIPITQALASSALMVGWTDTCTAVCPGHVLYGMPSVGPALAPNTGFSPVLHAVKSRVIDIREHGIDPGAGAAGGYHAKRCERRTVVVPCGLNDGNRSAVDGQTAEVFFAGRRLTVLGGSLEHLVIEVPDDVVIGVGDTVSIVGGEGEGRIDITEYAQWQGASSIECMLSLSARMPVIIRNN